MNQNTKFWYVKEIPQTAQSIFSIDKQTFCMFEHILEHYCKRNGFVFYISVRVIKIEEKNISLYV